MTVTKDDVRAWVAGYEKAWTSNEPDDIRALFAPGAEYRYEPYSAPEVDADAIVASWLEGRDEPGTWTFESDVVAVDGDLGVVEGRTVYPSLGKAYRNLWLVRLDAAGPRDILHRVLRRGEGSGAGRRSRRRRLSPLSVGVSQSVGSASALSTASRSSWVPSGRKWPDDVNRMFVAPLSALPPGMCGSKAPQIEVILLFASSWAPSERRVALFGEKARSVAPTRKRA